MRIFLPAPITQADVQRAIGVLRAAKIIVECGAVLVNGGGVASGVIMLHGDDAGEALGILAKAGIKASA